MPNPLSSLDDDRNRLRRSRASRQHLPRTTHKGHDPPAPRPRSTTSLDVPRRMAGSQIRSVPLALSVLHDPHFRSRHIVAFRILSLLRTSEVPSSSRPRISRHSFATSPHPGTTNASRTSNSPQKSPSASSMTPARPSKPSRTSKQLCTRLENRMRVSVRPTSPPALRRSHLAAAAARRNTRAGRGTSLP